MSLKFHILQYKQLKTIILTVVAQLINTTTTTKYKIKNKMIKVKTNKMS